MTARRRKLDVGTDGMADVMLLTNPLPRHLSIVDWGANDRPAVSWMSADAAPPHPGSTVLRDPPKAEAVTRSSLSVDAVEDFVRETVTAWRAVVQDTLDRPLLAADRSARIRGATAQASARVAALAHAVGEAKIQAVTKSRAAAPVEPLAPRTAATVETQIERTRFLAATEYLEAYLVEAALTAMAGTAPAQMTEAILGVFSEAGSYLASWAAEIRDGVVGVAPVEASTKAGARHAKADKARLEQIRLILDELDPPAPAESTEKTMNLEQLQLLAAADPVGFCSLIQKATQEANAKLPAGSKKFAFGETGVGQDSPEAIQLAGLIASAISGVDVEGASAKASPQAAATMKSAIVEAISTELAANLEGKLAKAIEAIIAPKVASALTASLKAYSEGSNPPSNQAGSGMFDFEAPSDLDSALSPQMPGLR
jgi:hypothetical protein